MFRTQEEMSFNSRLPSDEGDLRQYVGRLRDAGHSADGILRKLLTWSERTACGRVNVSARTFDLRSGRTVERANVHNIVINTGRLWHRDILAVESYPTEHTVIVGSPEYVNGGPGSDIEVDLADEAINNHRPRYVAVGVGGNKQTIVPPGPGSLYETVTAKGLERPVQVSGGTVPYWMKEVQGQPYGNEEYYPDYFPSAYAIRFRCILTDVDVSFADQPTYGTDVPISEYLLLTSAADRSIEPAHGDGSVDVIGALAYCTASPISKTPFNGLEVIWELRT